MDFNQFAFWMLTGLLGAVFVMIRSAINKLTSSIEGLNKTVAVEIEKSRWLVLALEKHDRIIEKHEERISVLEKM